MKHNIDGSQKALCVCLGCAGAGAGATGASKTARRRFREHPSYGPTKRQANHQCLNRNILKNFAIIIFHTYLRRLGSQLTSIQCDPGRS